MSPGDDEHFRYFLSTRWGVPLYVIDNLPASEFIHQKLFWSRFRWGLLDDLLAICVSQLVSFRTGNKPDTDVFAWKDMALSKGGFVIRRVTAASTTRVRQGFMMLAKFLGRKK